MLHVKCMGRVLSWKVHNLFSHVGIQFKKRALSLWDIPSVPGLNVVILISVFSHPFKVCKLMKGIIICRIAQTFNCTHTKTYGTFLCCSALVAVGFTIGSKAQPMEVSTCTHHNRGYGTPCLCVIRR